MLASMPSLPAPSGQELHGPLCSCQGRPRHPAVRSVLQQGEFSWDRIAFLLHLNTLVPQPEMCCEGGTHSGGDPLDRTDADFAHPSYQKVPPRLHPCAAAPYALAASWPHVSMQFVRFAVQLCQHGSPRPSTRPEDGDWERCPLNSSQCATAHSPQAPAPPQNCVNDASALLQAPAGAPAPQLHPFLDD